MRVILTSSLGGSVKVNGGRFPSTLLQENGLLDRIKSIWPENAKVMMIAAAPNNYVINDGIYNCFKEAFPMSGLSISSIEVCDDRDEGMIERLGEMDVVVLVGGHVPTQNAFLNRLGLKEKLQGYQGLVLAWSAGSMNCAETVYAGPELEGEAVDPNYQRWIPGLGLTKVNIFPHFQKLRGEMLDGMRLIEDITYGDSMGHEILALNDGSYIAIEDGVETLYGAAFSIKDGQLKQICENGQAVVLG